MNLLKRARELALRREWPKLAALHETEVSPGDLVGCPELAYLLSDALRRTGQMERARPLAEEAESGASRAADARLHLRSINLIGMIDFESGAMDAAGRRFAELLERASDADDDEFAARASNNLGILANIRGQTELALTSYQRALAAYHRIGYARGLAQTHFNLGISYRDLGFTDEADAHYARAMEFAEDTDSEDVIALAETERALLRARDGDGHLAESLATRALGRLQRMGDPAGAANAVRVLASAALARGAPDLALQRLDQALGTTRAHPDLLLRAEIQRDRGLVLVDLRDTSAAVNALREALEAFRQIGATREIDATRKLLTTLTPEAEQL